MICVDSPPPAGTMYRLNSPPRLPEYRMTEPSGDQAGPNSRPGSEVSRIGSPPSAAITNTSGGAYRSDVYAIIFPSGDQSDPPIQFCVGVTWTGSPPPAGIRYSASLPDSSDTNAICFPSADTDGAVSSDGAAVNCEPPALSSYPAVDAESSAESPPPQALTDNATNAKKPGTAMGIFIETPLRWEWDTPRLSEFPKGVHFRRV